MAINKKKKIACDLFTMLCLGKICRDAVVRELLDIEGNKTA